MSVRSVGDLRYCCYANGAPGKGLLKIEGGRLLNLEVDSIASGTNAELLRNVRKAMLNDTRRPGCSRCYKEEDAGMYSRRQAEIVEWEDYITKDKITRRTGLNGSIRLEYFSIVYLEL